MKIGIISDTHDFFDPRLPELFAGVEHILHAGDIGSDSIIYQLEEIAPVTAVVGNNDPDLSYRETELVTLGGRKFLIHHIVAPRSLSKITREIDNAQPDVVIFGHSHQRCNEVIEGRLYFNPGYAGKPRFNQPRSIAILHGTEKRLRAEFIELK